MNSVVKVEDLDQYIGTKLGPTEWLTIDQDRVNLFADATLDHQFIHVDPKAARETPFGGTIAHGFLTLSLLSYFSESLFLPVDGVLAMVNYGSDKLRFINPVKVDSEIRATGSLVGVIKKDSNQLLLKYAVTVEIKGQEKPALVADWLCLLVLN